MPSGKYMLTGKLMSGTKVSHYNITDSKGVSKKVTREQLIFLVGKGAIANCTGQLYGEQVIIRSSNGKSLNDLPIIDTNKHAIRNAKQGVRVRPDKNNLEAVFNQCTLIGRVVRGNKNVSFFAEMPGGATKELLREQVEQLALNRQVTNAKVQRCKDSSKGGQTRLILRGVGIELSNLPTMNSTLGL